MTCEYGRYIEWCYIIIPLIIFIFYNVKIVFKKWEIIPLIIFIFYNVKIVFKKWEIKRVVVVITLSEMFVTVVTSQELDHV